MTSMSRDDLLPAVTVSSPVAWLRPEPLVTGCLVWRCGFTQKYPTHPGRWKPVGFHLPFLSFARSLQVVLGLAAVCVSSDYSVRPSLRFLGALIGVERAVGSFEQFSGGFRGLIARQARRKLDRQANSSEMDFAGAKSRQERGNLVRRALRQEQQEFVAAHANDQVLSPAPVGELLGKGAQHQVPLDVRAGR